MAKRNKQAQTFARQLLTLSLENGVVSPERVSGVLAYLQKNPPAEPMAVLQAYRRYVALELAKSQAIVEHAGPVSDDALRAIESTLSRRYGRTITASPRRDDSLIAGVRVRVVDDVYESSVDAQLDALAATTA